MKKTYFLIFAFFCILTFCVSILAQLPNNVEMYIGCVLLGNVLSPPGTSIRVYNNDTGEFLAEYFTTENDSSNYSLSITVTENTSSTDNRSNTGDKLRFTVNEINCTSPYPGEYNITSVPGGLPGFPILVNLSAPPSCVDRVQNGNETGIDCDATCTKCYDLAAAPLAIQKRLKQNQSELSSITLRNSGYNNLTGLVINVSNGCTNTTLNLTPNSFPLLNGSGSGISTSGQSLSISLNISVGEVSDAFYNCTILINSTENTSKTIAVEVLVTSLEYMNISLGYGWNLVSIPLEPG